MGEVNIDPNLEDKLYNLVFTLHSKEYFGFMDSAFDYVDKIIAFIHTIPSQKYKVAYNKKFGAYYCSFKANSNTTWYVIFDRQDNKFFVNEITNNHCADYAFVISMIK
jgi:hypothetical protein